MKPTRFRLKIGVKRAVIIEVVLGQIGKDTGVETDRRDPLLINAMRRNFHRHSAATVVPYPGKQCPKFDRTGCRVTRRLNRFAVIHLYRADHTSAMPCGLHHAMKQKRGGCLTVRTGDSCNGEIFPGITR